MTLIEFIAEYAPAIVSTILGAVALFVASARNQVDDRQQELAMQGLYLEVSREDRETMKALRRELDDQRKREIKLQEEITNLKVMTAQGRADSDSLVRDLEAAKEKRRQDEQQYQAQIDQLREANKQWDDKVKVMAKENGELREQVRTLQDDLQALQRRVQEVETRAQENADQAERLRSALDDETAKRERAEAERDALREERDRLAKQVNALQAQLDESDTRVREQAEALAALRAEIEQLKTQIKGKDEGDNDDTQA